MKLPKSEPIYIQPNFYNDSSKLNIYFWKITANNDYFIYKIVGLACQYRDEIHSLEN